MRWEGSCVSYHQLVGLFISLIGVRMLLGFARQYLASKSVIILFVFDFHAERPLKNTLMHSWYHVSSAEWSSPIREHDVILNARMKELFYNKHKIPADETHHGSHGWSDRRDIGQRVSLLLLVLEFGMCRITFLHHGAAYLCLRVQVSFG